jgi:hypothetical protein
VFNLTSAQNAVSCSLKFTATRQFGSGDYIATIYCAGTNLSRQAGARWQALATGPVLAQPTLNDNAQYVCTFNPNYLPLGQNFVFIAWTTGSWNQWSRVTYDSLILHNN